MTVVAMPSRKKSWQTGRQRVSVALALAIQRENVMQRLIRLRVEIGHPEKEGEPLPQDQAAQRAGVTARQWQRWESGVSVPYARNLSAVADAFKFDVSEFYDGPAGQKPAATPNPFAADENGNQLDRIEAKLDLLLAALVPAPIEVLEDDAVDLDRLPEDREDDEPEPHTEQPAARTSPRTGSSRASQRRTA